jgi:ArsR family transcriptional regulator, arsenate/arsenite/antimonite-responsive transcriptional repressor
MSVGPLPIVSPRLTEDDAAATATLFRALGDPVRVRIINIVANSGEPVCICELVAELGLSQPTVSHHVRKLVDLELLVREERGKWTYLTIGAQACRRLGSLVDFRSCC